MRYFSCICSLLFLLCSSPFAYTEKITSQNNGKLEFHNERDRRQGVRARETKRERGRKTVGVKVVRYGKTTGLDSMLLSVGGDLLTVLWFIKICDACSEVFSIREL